MLSINPNSVRAINFKGFKEDLSLVVRDIQELGTVSDTAIDLQVSKMKSNRLKPDGKTVKDISILEDKRDQVASKIDELRSSLEGKFKTFISYAKGLMKAVEENKVANCGELAVMA